MIRLYAFCCSAAFWSSPVLIALVGGFFTSISTLGGIWLNGWIQKRDRAKQTQTLETKVGKVQETATETKTIVNGEREKMQVRIAELEAELENRRRGG